MKIFPHANRNRAMTLIELFIVLAVLTILAVFILDAKLHERNIRARVLRIQCMSNLRATGTAWRVWADDNKGAFPMDVAQTNGGSAEFITGPNAFRHFQVMSNEIATPKVLLCPSDWLNGSSFATGLRVPATNFTTFNNSNLSFFVGIDAKETNSAMFLSGDRNLTNGINIKNGLLELTANPSAGLTTDIHSGIGNILFVDGSVRQMSNSNLRAAIANTGLATNRLQMPVLTP